MDTDHRMNMIRNAKSKGEFAFLIMFNMNMRKYNYTVKGWVYTYSDSETAVHASFRSLSSSCVNFLGLKPEPSSLSA